MRKAVARAATSLPTRPKPTTARVLPASSMPTNWLRSHSPFLSEDVACGMCRAREAMSAKVVLGG